MNKTMTFLAPMAQHTLVEVPERLQRDLILSHSQGGDNPSNVVLGVV